MNVFEIVSDNCESKNYLAESWNILTEQQRSVLRECESELWPLMEELVSLFESRLRPESIEKLFTAAEEQSQGKLTGAGKAARSTKDAAKLSSNTLKKINAKINELGKKLQDTEPVQNFDSQFEKLKRDIKQKAGNDSKITKQVEKYGDWAKQNPGKTAFVIGVLTAAAAFAGGPSGGAAVGFLLRSANEITKGEKASSAAGKAAKTAAVGALAGIATANVSSAVTDAVAEMGVNDIDAAREAFTQANLEDAMADVESTYGDVIPDDVEDYSKLKGSVSLNSFSYDFDVYMSPEQVQEYQSLSDAWQSAELGTTENREAFLKVVDFVEGVADDPQQSTLRQYSAALEAAQDAGLSTEQVNQLSSNTNDLADQIDAMSKAEPKIAAAVQAAAQQADEIKKQEPEVSESVNEDLKDRIKGAAGNVKKQATQAVTKQKLMKAWKKQGKPLDYGSIINIMQSAGLKKDEIEKVAQTAKVELPMRSQDKNIKPGQTVQGPDGESYNWKGAQWVNNKTGRVARKDLAQQLSQTAKSSGSSSAGTQADANSVTGTDLEKLAQQIKQAGLTDRVKQYLAN